MMIQTERSSNEPRGIDWPTPWGIGGRINWPAACGGGLEFCARAGMGCIGLVPAMAPPETTPLVALAEKAEREPLDIMRSTIARIDEDFLNETLQ